METIASLCMPLPSDILKQIISESYQFNPGDIPALEMCSKYLCKAVREHPETQKIWKAKVCTKFQPYLLSIQITKIVWKDQFFYFVNEEKEVLQKISDRDQPCDNVEQDVKRKISFCNWGFENIYLNNCHPNWLRDTLNPHLKDNSCAYKYYENSADGLYCWAKWHKKMKNSHAKEYLKQAADKNHLIAQAEYAKHSSSPFEYIKKAAEGGLPIAQFSLACLYLFGKETEYNLPEAFRYFSFAVQNGYKVATRYLALCFLQGMGTDEPPEKGFRLLQEAAKKELFYLDIGIRDDDLGIMNYLLGECYLTGKGTQKDLKKAFEIFEFVATKFKTSESKELADLQLGYCYRDGEGTEKDPKRAFEKFTLISKDSHVFRYELGICYRDGIGTEKDAGLAFNHFYAASRIQGHHYHALYELALCYYKGEGTHKNDESAFISLHIYFMNRGSHDNVQAKELFQLLANTLKKDIKMDELVLFETPQPHRLLLLEFDFTLDEDTGNGIKDRPPREIEPNRMV